MKKMRQHAFRCKQITTVCLQSVSVLNWLNEMKWIVHANVSIVTRALSSHVIYHTVIIGLFVAFILTINVPNWILNTFVVCIEVALAYMCIWIKWTIGRKAVGKGNDENAYKYIYIYKHKRRKWRKIMKEFFNSKNK